LQTDYDAAIVGCVGQFSSKVFRVMWEKEVLPILLLERNSSWSALWRSSYACQIV
jgi:hypothetical protein